MFWEPGCLAYRDFFPIPVTKLFLSDSCEQTGPLKIGYSGQFVLEELLHFQHYIVKNKLKKIQQKQKKQKKREKQTKTKKKKKKRRAQGDGMD